MCANVWNSSKFWPVLGMDLDVIVIYLGHAEEAGLRMTME